MEYNRLLKNNFTLSDIVIKRKQQLFLFQEQFQFLKLYQLSNYTELTIR